MRDRRQVIRHKVLELVRVTAEVLPIVFERCNHNRCDLVARFRQEILALPATELDAANDEDRSHEEWDRGASGGGSAPAQQRERHSRKREHRVLDGATPGERDWTQ